MKFLVMLKLRGSTLPSSEVFDAAKAWTTANIAQNLTDCSYSFVTGGGGFSIANADSQEALMERLESYPAFAAVGAARAG